MKFMIGSHKFETSNEDDAVKIAKKVMMASGWRNLRLMKKGNDGWEVCRLIPSFEK